MTAAYAQDADEEYFVPCEFEYKVDPCTQRERAVTPTEINQKFGTGHRFRQAVFTLGFEYGQFIRQRFREKQS
jgi:hypothetical protein